MLAVAVAVVGAALSPRPAHADVSFDAAMFQLINQDRSANGLAPLAWFGDLGTIAEDAPYKGCGFLVNGRAVDMGVRNYFAHTILNCGTQNVFNMMQTYGVPFTSAGENIGAESGAADAAAAAAQINNAFMSEVPPNDGHKRNILSSSFTHVGVGSWHTPSGQAWTGAGSPWMNAYVGAEDFAALPPGSTGSAAARVDPQSIDFGSQGVGTTSASRSVTLFSSGTANLMVSSAALGNPNPGDFTITSDGCSGQSIPAGGTCTVGVAFTPTTGGLRTANLLLTDSAASSPQQVSLTGNDPGATAVTALSLSNGPVSGGTILTVSGLHLSGATAVQFGSVPAASFATLDDRTLQATSPAGALGPVDVVVTAPAGTSTTSAADRFTYVTPPSGSYQPSQPTRICDTRPSAKNGGFTNQCNAGGSGSPLGPGETRDIQVCDGFGGGSACSLGAVTLNLTITNPTAPGSFLTVWPADGTAQPNASNLNYTQGITRANLAEVKVAPNGKVSLFNQAGTVDVIVDREGTVPSAGALVAGSPGLLHPLPPARICDTRPPSSFVTATPCDSPAGGPLTAGETRTIQVAGTGGVPASGVSAVVLNATVTNTTNPSYLTAWPAANPQPNASNLNWSPGQTVPNRVVVPVGHNGQISVFNWFGTTDLVLDVNGWFGDGTEGPPPGATFTGIRPTRICDTRAPSASVPRNQCDTVGASPLTDGRETMTVQATGSGQPVPASARGIVANVTVTGTSADSYLTVWPAGGSPPTASDLNWSAGQTVPNLVVVQPNGVGAIGIANAYGTTDVIVDVVGYYS